MLHGLTVPVTEEILQHFLLVLETQAKLLCYLTLSWAQLAQQSCCKLLNNGEERRDGEALLPSNCKLLKDEQVFSLGVAERATSQQAQPFTGPKLSKHWVQVQVPSSGRRALVWDHFLCRQTD